MTLTLEVIAILLSCVSFVVTVLGFFASLKFYRDGVSLQNQANDVLSNLSAKTNVIENQVGNLFDRTLTAALDRKAVVSENIEDLEAQLNEARTTLDEAIGQIGEAGADQRVRIKKAVDEQLALIQGQLETTKGSVEDLTQRALTSNEISMLQAVSRSGEQGLILDHISTKFPVLEQLADMGLLRGDVVKSPSTYRFQLSEKGVQRLDGYYTPRRLNLS